MSLICLSFLLTIVTIIILMIMIIITIIVKPPAALQFLTLGFQEGLLKIQNKCNKLTNKTN